MERRIVPIIVGLAVLTAGVGVTVVPRVGRAECAPFGENTLMESYLGVGFEGVVTSVEHRPYSPAYRNSYNWIVSVDVTQALAGVVPRSVVFRGYDAGCSAITGQNLQVDDRVIISLVGPDIGTDLGSSADVLLWMKIESSWSLSNDVLRGSERQGTYPVEAREARTYEEIVAIVDPSGQAGVIVDCPVESASPRPSAKVMPSGSPAASSVASGEPGPVATPAFDPCGSVEITGFPVDDGGRSNLR